MTQHAPSGDAADLARFGYTQELRRQLGLILNKLVANDQAQVVIEAAQRGLPSIISSRVLAGKPTAEYITRDEFTEFKESLMQRLKSFIGELA